jgi:hypothetical protein
MAARQEDLSHATWRKSSHSGQDGNCIEVAADIPGVIAVRDSKDPDGPAIKLSHSAWAAFIQDVRATEA